MKKGETSRQGDQPEGVWLKDGSATKCEMLVPYSLMGIWAWPASGDLGFSLVWTHKGADGKITRLMWVEDGHPWNTRWYGVIRKVADKKAGLPYRVRIK